MRQSPSAAGVHGANDIFPGFFCGEKFEKPLPNPGEEPKYSPAWYVFL